MPRKPVFLGGLLLAAALGIWAASRRPGAPETIFEPPSRTVDLASPCPWRDAESDLPRWFPGATRFAGDDLILSGQRVELQQRLGRALLPEEHALHLYRVESNRTPVGVVLTRRIKGSGGAIEIAVALSPDGRIGHLKVQRHREPPAIAAVLEDPRLGEHFSGRSVRDSLEPPPVPAIAEPVARELAAAVRSLLVLFDAGRGLPGAHRHH